MGIRYSGLDWAVIVEWAGGRAALIVLLLVLALAVRLAARRLLPRLIKTTIIKRAQSTDEDELAKRYQTLGSVSVKTIDVLVMLIFAFMALELLGVNISPILATVSVAGIAIGFGAQTMIKDLLAGFFILLENQYGKGDVVRIAGISGLVEDVNLRRTVLRDQDGTLHTVPNGDVRVASNMTRDWSRVNVTVTVGYGESLDRAISLINRVGVELANDPDLGAAIVEPPKTLRVESFEEPGIAIKILGTTRPGKQWVVAGELRRRLKEAFEAESMVFAYSHRQSLVGPSQPPGQN